MTDTSPHLATLKTLEQNKRLSARDAESRPAVHETLIHQAEALAFAIRAIEERDELRDAIMSFMEKWEQVQPAIDSAFTMSYVHGGRYTGPTLEPELVRFNAILKG